MEHPNVPCFVRNKSAYRESALIHSVVESLQDVQDAIARARYCSDGLDEAFDRLLVHFEDKSVPANLPV